QNNSQGRGHVVVVSCGIAGAAAANRLHRNRFEVTVLEAEQRIGGRTSTRHQDGFKIDLAASMLLTSYKRTVELIAEQHWESHFEPAADVIGVERAGRVHHIRASKPLSVLTTGQLSPRAKTRLGVVAKDVANRDLERFMSLTPPASRICFAGDAMSSSTSTRACAPVNAPPTKSSQQSPNDRDVVLQTSAPERPLKAAVCTIA